MSVPKEWEDETTAATEPTEPRPLESGRKRPCLTVLTGGASGVQIKIGKGQAVIGRAPNAGIKLEDDGVSRNHARIRAESNQAWVEDLASRNGTFVNGIRITSALELRDGDKIQLGRATVLRFGFQDALDESFHENLLSSALRDGLTKLFNRRYLLDRIDSELKFASRHGTAVSLIVLDIDHFKKVNDSHGHLAGDAVLVTVANVLTKAVRNEDVVARYGGEEFAVVLRAIGLDAAVHMAERLRRTIAQTATAVGELSLSATVSVGVAGYPVVPAATPEELVDAADQAMYRAKHAGRNNVQR